MGYTTDFTGRFNLNKPLDIAHANYLREFARTRRVARNPLLTKQREDTIRLAVDLPVGPQGRYFVGEGDFGGQGHGSDITDYNNPPDGQPSLWNQWVPTKDGLGIEWDGGEKFYGYIDWLRYLIEHFLGPWGYELNGEVEYQGEDAKDFGKIVIRSNLVDQKIGKRSV